MLATGGVAVIACFAKLVLINSNVMPNMKKEANTICLYLQLLIGEQCYSSKYPFRFLANAR